MTAGDIALTAMPQADGSRKLRPVLLLKRFPPFGDFLVCGISSQIDHEVSGFDHLIESETSEFAETGLKVPSLVRLGFLAVLPEAHFAGRIGSISAARVNALLRRLAEFLVKS